MFALHSLHRGHKYASFRWVPSDLVKCHFSLEHFDSLFYGGQNFTDYVEGNRSEPSEARKMMSWSKLSKPSKLGCFGMFASCVCSWINMNICQICHLWCRLFTWSLLSMSVLIWSSLGKISAVLPVLDPAFVFPAPMASSLKEIGRSVLGQLSQGRASTVEPWRPWLMTASLERSNEQSTIYYNYILRMYITIDSRYL